MILGVQAIIWVCAAVALLLFIVGATDKERAARFVSAGLALGLASALFSILYRYVLQ